MFHFLRQQRWALALSLPCLLLCWHHVAAQPSGTESTTTVTASPAAEDTSPAAKPVSIAVGDRVTSKHEVLVIGALEGPLQEIRLPKSVSLLVTDIEPGKVRVHTMHEGKAIDGWVADDTVLPVKQSLPEIDAKEQQRKQRLNAKARDILDNAMADIEFSQSGKEIDSEIESLCIQRRAYAAATKGFWTVEEEKQLMQWAEQIKLSALLPAAWSQLSRKDKQAVIDGELFDSELLTALLERFPLEPTDDAVPAKSPGK